MNYLSKAHIMNQWENQENQKISGKTVQNQDFAL